jgi:serine phosphatase RsbU (regulator of sigma subunit)
MIRPSRPPLGSAELEAQLKALSRMIVQLRKSEHAHRRSARFGKLLGELAQRTLGSFSLQGILQHMTTFATRDLGLQRCVVLLDDRGTGQFTARSHSGYPSEQHRRQLLKAELPIDHPAVALLRSRGVALYREDAAIPELGELAQQFALDRFWAAPLFGATKNVLGVLLAGTTAADAWQYEQVEPEGAAATAFATFAEQSSVALNGCILHWELAVERNLLEAKISERTEELTRAYTQIQEDLDQAREFQSNILPTPPEIAGLKLEVCYRPADLVGGDLYDIETRADGRVLVFVADATGHGVRAALTTMFIKSEYDLARQNSDSPAELLRLLNDSIAGLYSRLDMRFSALCAEVDLARGKLVWSSAGHPAPCLVRGGQARELDTGGCYMGMAKGVDFPTWELELQGGDAFFLLTDGAFEVFAPDGAQYSEERAYAVIARETRRLRPAGATLYADLQDFSGNKQLPDDFTLIGVRLSPE